MKTVKLGFNFIVAIALAVATQAQAAVIFSDDFTEITNAQNINFTGLTNWNVTAGAIDAFLNGGFGLSCPSFGCLDMDGTTTTAGTIETKTTFNLSAGDYVLTLNVAGNQRVASSDSMDVLFSGAVLNTITLAENDPYQFIQLPFTLAVASSGTIVLSHAGGDQFGILLDSVELADSVIPIPAAFWLFASGALGLVSIAKRRRN
ncbi:MAG: hypothetical protein WBO34_13345 [Gammaproteobacteria bacterium]